MKIPYYSIFMVAPDGTVECVPRWDIARAELENYRRAIGADIKRWMAQGSKRVLYRNAVPTDAPDYSERLLEMAIALRWEAAEAIIRAEMMEKEAIEAE